MALRIRRDDVVQVITGPDKGTIAKVLSVDVANSRLTVEGVAMVKKHQKARSEREPGAIVERERPIHYSNVLLYCEGCKAGRRFSVQVKEDGSKVRLCKKCNATL
jgi:large subunit ribosomal protein L24